MLPDSIDLWLRHAKADLSLAKKIPEEDDLLELFCFHAQQCAEKSLKAILLANQQDLPRTHDIAFLLKLVSNFIPIPDRIISAAELTTYAVSTRYPELTEDVTIDELESAILIANEVYEWTRNILIESKGE